MKFANIALLCSLFIYQVVCQEPFFNPLDRCKELVKPENICGRNGAVNVFEINFCICGGSKCKEFEVIHKHFQKKCAGDEVTNAINSFTKDPENFNTCPQDISIFYCPAFIKKYPQFGACGDEKQRALKIACDRCAKCRH
jgi:hypothetical protein